VKYKVAVSIVDGDRHRIVRQRRSGAETLGYKTQGNGLKVAPDVLALLRQQRTVRAKAMIYKDAAAAAFERAQGVDNS
jgi:hypothetical protein